MENPRIAWLLTSAFYYWQPTMSSLTKLLPQTTVFTSRWPGFAPGLQDSFKVEVVGERKVIALTKSSKSYGDNFTYLPLSIVSYLLKFKPNVIFSNAFGMWTILALLFKSVGGWRVVIAYEGSSPGVDYRNSALRLALRRAMVKASDACITNSRAGKAYLTEFLKAQESRVFVQPYEVPGFDSLMGQMVEIPANLSQIKHPVFLFVGGVIPRKGLQYLLEACAILQHQGCDNYTLAIVGDGTQREELENWCQGKGLSDRVQWIGQVEYNKLGNYFALADVFVLPTLEDTWGMVILEAMALGKAVLSSKWAGASELILEGENGYCFDPYEPGKLAELMHSFIKNPQLAVAMGERSKQLMTQYTPEAAAKFLREVTYSVLGSTPV
jgi:glycosyltransferase involved in cell wall biosynthesis